MFAVIEEGSHQYRVRAGETLTVDFRDGAKDGDSIRFDRVLLASAGGASVIGRPLIDGATVAAVVVDPLVKGDKIEVQKLRRRKNSRRHTGHRQKYTTVRVTEIAVPGLDVVCEQAAPVAADAAPPAVEPAESTDSQAVAATPATAPAAGDATAANA
jgi:large subunit ribosomal protein L21